MEPFYTVASMFDSVELLKTIIENRGGYPLGALTVEVVEILTPRWNEERKEWLERSDVVYRISQPGEDK